MMNKKIGWLIFVCYILVSGFTIAHHELWGDEVHSWNISKGSGSYSDLISNRRFEGHPPGWYTVCWTISKFTHDPAYMQAAQWIIACAVAFLIIFYSPFPLFAKVLIPFGYYFLFEFSAFSRNYALALLFLFLICIVLRRDFKYKYPVYYLLLFCASNTHLLALLLAGCLHLYLLNLINRRDRPIHALLGILIAIPAIHFIFPPSDSALNTGYWLHRWDVHQLTASVQGPLRSFLPIPAWWDKHCWNTQFLIDAKNNYPIFRIINLVTAIALMIFGFFMLRADRKSTILFGANLFLNLTLAIGVFPLTTARYAGFIFIGFITAWWMYCYDNPITPAIRRWMSAFLGIHVLAGLFFVIQDARLPFSNLPRINELIKEVPPGRRLITDYWTMNGISAFTDRPAYCVDMNKEISFVLWNPDLTALMNNPNRYTTGLEQFFRKENRHDTYMISLGSPQDLARADSLLDRRFHITLLDSREGAIEKGSNIYLYHIESL